jgi:uncharacterized Fe-S cluster protein YjdI
MKVIFENNEFLFVREDVDHCFSAYAEGFKGGFEFRELEICYDVLPSWVCKNCGKRVYAGWNEASGFVGAYSALYSKKLCEPCTIEENRRIIEIKEICAKMENCLRGTEEEEVPRLAQELWVRNEEGDRELVEGFMRSGHLSMKNYRIVLGESRKKINMTE